MSKELFCYDCKRPANTECVEQKHRTEEVEIMGEEQRRMNPCLPWKVEPEPVHGWRIRDANGSRVIRDIYWEQLARFTARAANEYHGDKEALRGVAIMLNTELAKYEDEPWAQRVREALAEKEI